MYNSTKKEKRFMIQNIATSQVTKPTTLCDEIERYLQKVFEAELNASGSILVSYTPFVIKKIAAYLSGRIKMPEKLPAENLQLLWI